MNLLLVLTRLIWKRLTQNWGGAFEREATKNILYDKTLEKESNNYFYADFSNIDFTQYKNLKLFISSDVDQGNISFFYEKDKTVGDNHSKASSLKDGAITSKYVNNFTIWKNQSIDMQYIKISFGNQIHIGISTFSKVDGFLFGELVFGSGYTGTGPNFWGIGLNYGTSYTGVVRVTVTGDKIS